MDHLSTPKKMPVRVYMRKGKRKVSPTQCLDVVAVSSKKRKPRINYPSLDPDQTPCKCNLAQKTKQNKTQNTKR